MSPETSFHFEVEESEDEYKLPMTTIKCHGRLTSSNAGEMKELVRPLINEGGRHIVIDCSELESMDSSGLGALVGLKVSSINQGLGKLEFINLSPRVRELLKLTSLTELFTK